MKNMIVTAKICTRINYIPKNRKVNNYNQRLRTKTYPGTADVGDPVKRGKVIAPWQGLHVGIEIE